MRINSISIRLNYSLSWQNKLLPGRTYDNFFSSLQITTLEYLKKIFAYKKIKNFILLSQIKLKIFSNKFCVVNLYLYSYKYAEVQDMLAKNKKSKQNLVLFLKNIFICKTLSKVEYLIQNTVNTYLLKINFILVVNRFFKSELVSIYVVEKLKNKFKLNKIVSNISKTIVLHKQNKGVLVQCSGRFDRKERASYQIFSYGKISMSTFKNKISYSQNQVTLKYGVCGIKVWLLK